VQFDAARRAPGQAGPPGIGSCALRDTFLGHPVSVYPGSVEILAHRACALPTSMDVPGRTDPNSMFAHSVPLNVKAMMSYHVPDAYDDGGATDREHESSAKVGDFGPVAPDATRYCEMDRAG
jgi:hypothetical protein